MAVNNLFPDGYENEVVDQESLVSGRPIGYKPGPAFDYQTGDFVRDGRNYVLGNTGIEAWKSWVVNCIQTERFKYLAYNTDFGIELDKVFATTSRQEAESILTREIKEAILADPYGRTAYIDSIEYSWMGPDAVQVSATIVGIDDVTIDVTANIQQKGESD